MPLKDLNTLLTPINTSAEPLSAHVIAERAPKFEEQRKAWSMIRSSAKGRKLYPTDEQISRITVKVRAWVEHPFRDIKRQFGYVKTRYRGLPKNHAQLFTLFPLGNLFLVRRKLMA